MLLTKDRIDDVVRLLQRADQLNAQMRGLTAAEEFYVTYKIKDHENSMHMIVLGRTPIKTSWAGADGALAKAVRLCAFAYYRDKLIQVKDELARIGVTVDAVTNAASYQQPPPVRITATTEGLD